MNLESGVMQIHIEDIIPNRFQPRLNFDEQALNELADSIKEHGIIQPLVLRKLGDKYEIIAGERRYKAAQMAGLTTVPAVIANVDDNTAAEAAIVENVQRSNLTAIEEARSYKNLLDKGYLTQEQLAKKMGLSQAAVANKLRLLNLDEEVQQALLEGEISERHGRTLLSIKDKEEQKEWLHRIINERLTVRQLDMELKKVQEENNLLGISDDEEEVPLVESSRSIDDIRGNAMDINDANRMSEEDNMTQPKVINEEVETLDGVDFGNEPIIEEPLPEPEKPNFDQIKPLETSAADEDEDSGRSYNNFNEPVHVEGYNIQGYNDNHDNDSFVTATSVPESSIVSPESTESYVPQEDFAPRNDNKYFGFGKGQPEADNDDDSLVSASTVINKDSRPNNNPNNFEVFDDPMAGNKATSESDDNPFDQPEPQAFKPIEEEEHNLNTAFDVNPNNKFFKPVYDTNKMENMQMVTENERIVDPMESVERFSPEYKAKELAAKEMGLKDAIEQIRNTIEDLGEEGFYINVEEIDFDTNYQITIQIKKDE